MTVLNDRFAFRISAETKHQFVRKAQAMGRDAPALNREFIQAFIDGRLTIEVDEETLKQTQGLYNVTRK